MQAAARLGADAVMEVRASASGADGGQWREPAGTGYASEDALQEILFEHPTLVPGVTGDVIACREFQSGIGPADVVILDSEGALTIVECKLAANAEVRRKIIGQVLDYGSRLWQMSITDFEQAWIRADPGSTTPFQALEDSEGRVRRALEANLAEPRFNLVLAVDAINDDLRRIVEYLNAITRPSTGVMLVEFTRYHDNNLEMLIPQTYGAELVEAKTDADPRRTRPRWTAQQYLNWCDENDPAGAPRMRTLLGSLEANGFYVNGGQAQSPSLNCAIEIPGKGRSWPICLYTDPIRGGLVEIRFSDLKNHPPLVAEFARRVCGVDGLPVELAEVEAANYRRRPSIPIRDFTEGAARDLCAAIASLRGI